jgi:hypothetical protein
VAVGFPGEALAGTPAVPSGAGVAAVVALATMAVAGVARSAMVTVVTGGVAVPPQLARQRTGMNRIRNLLIVTGRERGFGHLRRADPKGSKNPWGRGRLFKGLRGERRNVGVKDFMVVRAVLHSDRL